MRGLAQNVILGLSEAWIWSDPWKPGDGPPVIGVAASQKYPDIDRAKKAIRDLVTRYPDAVWVTSASKVGAERELREFLQTLAVDPVVLENNRAYWGTGATQWRLAEMVGCCDRLLVFHEPNSSTTVFFVDKAQLVDRIKIIESGEKRAPKRAKRKAPA